MSRSDILWREDPKFWGRSSDSSMNAPERILETNIGGIGPKLKVFSGPRLRFRIMLGAGVTEPEGMSSVGLNISLEFVANSTLSN